MVLVSEKVAEEMFCPLGFANTEGPYIKCVAKRCMAWRAYLHGEQTGGVEIGYCGLAGKVGKE